MTLWASGFNVGGVEWEYGTQSTPLFRQWCITVTSECDEGHTPPQPLTNCIRLLWGSPLIKQRQWCKAQGFMCGTSWQFLPASAVVGHGCDGHCWPVISDYFNSYTSLVHDQSFFGTIHSISNLSNLAVTSWAYSCFLSPGLYGKIVI